MSEPIRVAINGFGRVGRQAFKAAFGVTRGSRMVLSDRIHADDIEVVAINDLTDPRTLAHLLRYDSIYGRYHKEILIEHNHEVVDWEGHTSSDDHAIEMDEGPTFLIINGRRVQVFSQKDPEQLPWADLNVDVVLESTGFFTKYEDAKKHIKAGAKKVIISAPGKGEEGSDGRTLIFGTEDTEKGFGTHDVVSNASCTTNCISPVIQILVSRFGVEKSLMTTIHGYTASQNLVDGPNKNLRRGRAAAENIIPSSTGAAIATGYVIPSLAGKFDGIAMRVPVPVGSISDITAVLSKDVTVEEVNETLIEMSRHPLYKGILVTTQEPIVSTDIIGNPASSIVDLEFTRVVGGNMVKVVAWYDNEWGYSNRLVEMAIEVGKTIS
ncbi:type I glyceraldehyde-3-phosphate dehydrogenase [candidate division WWE3 bacterium CG_4_10_14_0_2_um_filter_41_14]|uniref:Glyceraldehyde-3-phosphate dehydrogenase n=1 Tax=candidate division WWE3 bacterium CG_4_10_14_0_2_um_filter_41_14 TaxID=1975072 RepID=A0A2M7TJZ8_UNCKA|nr:MAG: type I glyceraldehyde-3-phosphate dehydrogenase [candidate division WWE3 bacterium CG_4_10_14_0_2_um_filter_41_14]